MEKRTRAGRPRTYKVTIAVRIPEELRDWLYALADVRGVNPGDLITDAMEQYRGRMDSVTLEAVNGLLLVTRGERAAGVMAGSRDREMGLVGIIPPVPVDLRPTDREGRRKLMLLCGKDPLWVEDTLKMDRSDEEWEELMIHCRMQQLKVELKEWSMEDWKVIHRIRDKMINARSGLS